MKKNRNGYDIAGIVMCSIGGLFLGICMSHDTLLCILLRLPLALIIAMGSIILVVELKKKDLTQKEREILYFFNSQMLINQGNSILSIPLLNNEVLARIPVKKNTEGIQYKDEKIYDILCNVKTYLDTAEVLNAGYTHFTEHEIKQNRPLSYKQINRCLTILNLINEGNYNQALCALQDCIINNQTDAYTLVSVNEYIIYNCLISIFIDKVKIINTVS